MCAVFGFVYYVMWCPLCVYVLYNLCMYPYCCVVCVLYVPLCSVCPVCNPYVLCVLYVTPIAHMCVYVFMECVCCLCINKLCVTVDLCPAAPYEICIRPFPFPPSVHFEFSDRFRSPAFLFWLWRHATLHKDL